MFLVAVLFFLRSVLSENPFEHSGFINIDKEHDTNIYYQFFPHSNPDAPVLIWLQGGPGGSSMVGNFAEMGPYFISNDGKLTVREDAWTQDFSMIFIDQPAGVGFSYTGTGGYVKTEEDAASQLHDMLTGFFNVYPGYKKNDFYVSGESYAGKWVPGIAYEIIQRGFEINLKGIMVGDGWVNPILQSPFYPLVGYFFGVFDEAQRDKQFAMAEELEGDIIAEKWADCTYKWEEMMDHFFVDTTGCPNYFDIRNCEGYDFGPILHYFSLPEVKEMMHTTGKVFNETSLIVYENFRVPFCKSVHWKYEKILEAGVRVLIYTGQMDYVIPVVATETWVRELRWHGREQFNALERGIWKVDDHVAGYYKKYDNLYEMVVRNAGHLVPTDQPYWSRVMIREFVEDKL